MEATHELRRSSQGQTQRQSITFGQGHTLEIEHACTAREPRVTLPAPEVLLLQALHSRQFIDDVTYITCPDCTDNDYYNGERQRAVAIAALQARPSTGPAVRQSNRCRNSSHGTFTAAVVTGQQFYRTPSSEANESSSRILSKNALTQRVSNKEFPFVR